MTLTKKLAKMLHLTKSKKKHLVSRYDKNAIAMLPKANFPGRIIVILNESEAEKAVDYLLKQPILGFDTETRPCFHKGRINKVALLQVASHDTCFLFRLNHIGLPACLQRLMASTEVKKIGLSWHDDVRVMRHRCKDLQSNNFIELQQYVHEFGITDMSLQKLYANVFGQKISKAQQLSNWEADILSDAQKLYAATDAWACIKLYEELHRLEQTGDYETERIPEPEPVIIELTPEELAAKEEAKRQKRRMQRRRAMERTKSTKKSENGEKSKSRDAKGEEQPKQRKGQSQEKKNGKEANMTPEEIAKAKAKAKAKARAKAKKRRRNITKKQDNNNVQESISETR